MDQIKKAFDKVKQDISSLSEEITNLKTELREIKGILEANKTENQEKIQTDRQKNKTYSTFSSTDNYLFKPLKDQNLDISTGNRGVSTDRQTDRQTDRHIQNTIKNQNKEKNSTSKEISMDNAIKIFNSLDDIKKEIRLLFKDLTEQEFLVFSAIYQYDEEQKYTDYKELSRRLNLSESSIRDYVGRIIKKGVPIEKEKVNNKQIRLTISQNLKKIVSLDTIIQLRDL